MARDASVSFESKDHGKEKIRAALKVLKGHAALVGIPSGAKPAEKDGKPSKFTLAELAYVLEKGSAANNIPPRPFMKQTRERVESKFAKLLRSKLKAVQSLKQEPLTALKQVGLAYEGEMKASFTVESFAPNAPETIRRKGSSKPLIDTGHLRQSITTKVAKA